MSFASMIGRFTQMFNPFGNAAADQAAGQAFFDAAADDRASAAGEQAPTAEVQAVRIHWSKATVRKCANAEPHEAQGKIHLCDRCKLVGYCSKECQRTAWKTHKKFCKAPEEIHVKVTILKAGDEAGPTREIRRRVWKKACVDAAGEYRYRDEGIFGDVAPTNKRKKAEHKQELLEGARARGGNELRKRQVVRENVISCCQELEDPASIEAIRGKYQGLKGLSEAQITEMLNYQQYSVLIKHVRTENDLDHRINLLKQWAGERHVPMMCELGLALVMKLEVELKSDNKPSKQQLKQRTEEAWQWVLLGQHCALLDKHCIDDETLMQFSNWFGDTYTRTLIAYAPSLKRYGGQNYNEIRKIQEWQPSNALDKSPKWACYSGGAVLQGINATKPQAEWLEFRRRGQKTMREFPPFLQAAVMQPLPFGDWTSVFTSVGQNAPDLADMYEDAVAEASAVAPPSVEPVD